MSPVEPKQAHLQIIDIEFKYPNHNYWYRAAVSVSEYGAIMNSGLLHGRSIEAVKLWQAQEEDLGTASLVYSFLKAKSGLPGFEVFNDA